MKKHFGEILNMHVKNIKILETNFRLYTYTTIGFINAVNFLNFTFWEKYQTEQWKGLLKFLRCSRISRNYFLSLMLSQEIKVDQIRHDVTKRYREGFVLWISYLPAEQSRSWQNWWINFRLDLWFTRHFLL